MIVFNNNETKIVLASSDSYNDVMEFVVILYYIIPAPTVCEPHVPLCTSLLLLCKLLSA